MHDFSPPPEVCHFLFPRPFSVSAAAIGETSRNNSGSDVGIISVLPQTVLSGTPFIKHGPRTAVYPRLAGNQPRPEKLKRSIFHGGAGHRLPTAVHNKCKLRGCSTRCSGRSLCDEVSRSSNKEPALPTNVRVSVACVNFPGHECLAKKGQRRVVE